MLSISLIVRIITAAEGAGAHGILHFPSLVTFAHNKESKEGIIDLEAIEDCIGLITLHDDMKEQFKKNRAYILARLVTTTGNNIKILYLNASNINKWWFDNSLYPSSGGSYPNFKKNPENMLECRAEVPFFISYESKKNGISDYDFDYIGSTYDLMNGSNENRKFLCALLDANYGDIDQMSYRGACSFLHEVYTEPKRIPGVQKDTMLAAFYKEKFETSNADSVISYEPDDTLSCWIM